MEKDFKKWSNIKQKLEKRTINQFFKEWEIRWMSVWLNLKNESCWKWKDFRRPVLILKKLSSNTFIWIPLSSKIKTWSWFVKYKQGWIEFTALIYQIRMFDNIRFQRRIWEIDETDF